MKKLNLLLFFILLGSLFSTGMMSAPNLSSPMVTATLFPSALINLEGSARGKINTVTIRNQSGRQNSPGQYVRFITPRVVYSGYQKFNLPAHIDPADISDFAITLNYRGPLPISQVWTWRLYDWNTDTWVAIGTNANAVLRNWTLFTFVVPAPFDQYIGLDGEIRLQLESDNANGDAWVDYEALNITYSAQLPTGAYWQPAIVTSWQIQYSGTIDMNLDVDVYNLDAFDTPQETIDALHARGIKAMCYFSAGSWENWRPDKSQFPAYVLGKTLSGWPNEKWLDIRRIDILGPIMIARVDLCKSKGFDGIDPDNIDGYTNTTGLPLTAQDQLNYNIFLATIAHERGLSAGLKNDIDQAAVLSNYFDWELNEQCFYYNECDALQPFISAGKPVFNIEYDLDTTDFCSHANALNFNSLKKNLDLGVYREACR